MYKNGLPLAALVVIGQMSNCHAQSTSLTPNISLQVPAFQTSNWQVSINYDLQQLDKMLSGSISLPALNVNNLTVSGAISAANLQFTPAQISAGLGGTPTLTKNNLSDVSNAAQALTNLGGVPKSYVDAADTANANAAATAQSTATNAAQQAANATATASAAVQPGTSPSLVGVTLSGLTGCLQANGGSAVTSTGSPCGTGSGSAQAALPSSTAANQALVATSANTSSYTPTTLGKAAFSNSYLDLNNLPTIPTVPTKVSSFTNDVNYITAAGAPLQTVNGISPTNGNINVATGTATPAGTPTTYRLPVQVNSGGSTPTLAADNGVGYEPGSKTADALTHLEAPQTAFKGPKVNVLNSDFAGGADPTGATYSTAAVLAALAYAQSLGTSAYEPPVLYFPKGKYLISSALEMSYAANGTNGGVSFEGDGTGISVLIFSQAVGAGIEYMNLDPASGGHLHISNITLSGSGHTAAQSGIEIDNTQNVDVRDIEVVNMGDTAIKVQGGSERCNFDNLELISNRRSIVNSGNSNENYYTHLHIISPGIDGSNYSYNVNAQLNTSAVGTMPTTGNMYPDFHAAVSVYFGQNVHFKWGSLKSVQNAAGIQFFGTNGGTVGNMYVEGYGTPSINPSLQVGGQAPLGRITTALTASATTIPVDDGVYFPFIYSSANDVTQTATVGATSYGMVILPPDYNPANTTTLSSICTGVTNCPIYQSTRENVTVQGGYGATPTGAATMQVIRGQNGTTALAWPSGPVLTLPHNGDDGDVVSESMHYNGPQGLSNSQTNTCAMLPAANTTSWKYTPATVCGEIVLGPIIDGYDENLLTSPGGPSINAGGGLQNSQANLVRNNDVMYGNYGNPYNGGVVVVQSNATLTDNQGCFPSQTRNAAGTMAAYSEADPTQLYLNGVGCQVAYPQQSPTSPTQFLYKDLSGGATTGTVNRAFSQDFQVYHSNNDGTTGRLFNGEYDITDGGGITNFRTFGTLNGGTGVELDGATQNAWNVMLRNTGTQAAPTYVADENVTGNSTVQGSQTVTGPITPTGGIITPSTFYSGNATIAMPFGGQVVSFNSGATIALTGTVAQGYHETIVSVAPTPFSISTPSGTSIYINNTKYANTTVFPGFIGTLNFTSDFANDWIVTGVPEIGPVTIATGAGFASAALTAVAPSTVHAGRFTFTIPSGSTGTAGSVGITVTNTVATAAIPEKCSVDFVGASVPGYVTAAPTGTGFSWAPTNALAAGSYNANWSCTY